MNKNIEKNIPVKPNTGVDKITANKVYICPRCANFIKSYRQVWCVVCKQAFDWKDL